MIGELSTKERCGQCPIRHRAVCSRCDEDEMAFLESMKYYRSYEAGQPIRWRGDDLEYVASLVTGVAKISQTLEDGRTQTVGMLLPSDFIGRPGRKKVAFDVTAVTDVVLCCFHRGPFEDLLETTPHVNQRLLEMALDELDAAREWMLLLGRKTAREKIASFLRMIARRSDLPGEAADGRRIFLPLTREATADYLGLTIETVSRQITALKKEGIIRLVTNREIEVLSYTRLAQAAGEDIEI